MKILVTGAGGFLGRALTLALAERGHQVRALDNDSRGTLASLAVHPQIEPIAGDVLNHAQMMDCMAGMEVVYHLAYINGTKFFYTIPGKILEVGIIGTHNVLQACLHHRVPRFVLASSSEVYQHADVIPTPEAIACKVPDVTNPRYSYGGGKLACELLTINYLRESPTRWSIFRPHNVYGPAMGHEHVLPNLIHKVFTEVSGTSATQARIAIQGTGEETRSFIYIDDAVRAILCCCQDAAEGGIFHIGTGDEISIRDLVQLIGRVKGLQIDAVPSDGVAGSTPRRCPDVRKLAALGFAPQVSLETGVRQTMEWYWNEYSQRPHLPE